MAAGVVAEQDVGSLVFADTPEVAFDAIVAGLTELERKAGHVGAPGNLLDVA